MHPHRAQYPDDYYLYFLRSLRLGYVNGPLDFLLVSYTTDATGKEDRIVGIAHWLRMTAHAPPKDMSTAMTIRLVKLYNHLESFVYPNRAAEPSRLDILSRTAKYYQHHWTGTRGEVWMLSHIGIDPQFEGKGIGRELVEWGFERARADGVGCTVISAAGKEGFYRKCGFDIDDGNVHDYGGEANPLTKIPGGAIHFWDNGIAPSGVKTYEEA